MSKPFHLAIPAGNLDTAIDFYKNVLGCKLGNGEKDKWIDVDFWGNEIKKNIEQHDKVNYLDNPYTRFKGQKEEQETFFIEDPHGNVLELKTMKN